MTSILICCTPAQGHVAPLLAIATHLAGEGHDVRFLGGRAYADRVRAAGLPFLPLPEEGDLDLDHANEAYPERAALTGLKEVQWSMVNLFARPAVHQVRAIDAALAERPADVVLADLMSFGAILYCARPRSERLPLILVNIGPLQTVDPDSAPFGFGMPPLPAPFGRLRNRLLQAMSKPVFAPVVRELREAGEKVGVHLPDDFVFGDLPTATDRVIQLTVPAFEYPRPTIPDTVRFIGPVSRGATAPLPEWWDDLDGSRPVVHVSQGTVANNDLDQLVRPTIDALADEDVLLVIATGGRPVAGLGPLPANVRAAEYLPYDDLFPKLAAFVSNGGYGGLHFALRHGVPIVAAGTTEDKMETTARVAWSGTGINLKTRSPKPAAVRRAVRRVLGDPRYREAAARIGSDIAAAPGLAGVEAVIAELVPRAADRVRD
ncbi:glycosyltransferase [Microbacterium rhizophilus]|uniref:glycosyltransferase n=1 Tax=Microbacterium rhizophilus TaxID=3138934 RepID=UPI0031F0C13C